jgi:hypothetical protein
VCFSELTRGKLIRAALRRIAGFCNKNRVDRRSDRENSSTFARARGGLPLPVKASDKDSTTIAKIHMEVRVATGLPLESSVKTSCVETVDYSGYEHSHNYGLIATTLQLLSSSIECVVR